MSLSYRFPGAEGTTNALPSSAWIIFPTLTNCSALARELPPNLTTFFILHNSFPAISVYHSAYPNIFKNNARVRSPPCQSTLIIDSTLPNPAALSLYSASVISSVTNPHSPSAMPVYISTSPNTSLTFVSSAEGTRTKNFLTAPSIGDIASF